MGTEIHMLHRNIIRALLPRASNALLRGGATPPLFFSSLVVAPNRTREEARG